MLCCGCRRPWLSSSGTTAPSGTFTSTCRNCLSTRSNSVRRSSCMSRDLIGCPAAAVRSSATLRRRGAWPSTFKFQKSNAKILSFVKQLKKIPLLSISTIVRGKMFYNIMFLILFCCTALSINSLISRITIICWIHVYNSIQFHSILLVVVHSNMSVCNLLSLFNFLPDKPMYLYLLYHYQLFWVNLV